MKNKKHNLYSIIFLFALIFFLYPECSAKAAMNYSTKTKTEEGTIFNASRSIEQEIRQFRSPLTRVVLPSISISPSGTFHLNAGETKRFTINYGYNKGLHYQASLCTGFDPEGKEKYFDMDSDMMENYTTLDFKALSPGTYYTDVYYATSINGDHEVKYANKVKIIVLYEDGPFINTPEYADMKVGETKKFRTNIYGNISVPSSIKGYIKWETSDSSIATIDQNGNLTAKAPGEVLVTARSGNDYHSYSTVNITAPVTGIKVDPETAVINTGESTQINAVILPTNATEKSVIYQSSDNKIASVDAKGKVTGTGPGTATITATSIDGGFKAYSTITVLAPVTGVSINPEQITLKPEETYLLKAVIEPSNASNKNVIWSSKNIGIATVTSDGTVTGRSSGVTYITAKTEDGDFIANCKVTVHVPVEGVIVNPKSSELKVGEGKALSAQVLPSNATNQSVTWSSSNPSVAVVDENGYISAIGAGTVVITAKTVDGEIEDTCNIRVTSASSSVSGVRLDAQNLTLNLGDSHTLNAVVLPENASDKTVTWKSSNASVVTVYKGTITTKGAGTATVTATTREGGYTAECIVTVKSPTEVSVTGIQISSQNEILSLGKSLKLTATVLPANATNTGITWSSSNPSVLTVYQGTVTTKTVGIATVTATSKDGGYQAACRITVTDGSITPPTISVTGVQMTQDEISIDEDETILLQAEVIPGNATDQVIHWTSSDETVAVVDTDGNVTGTGGGTAIITATTNDGGFTASCNVAVTSKIISATGITLDHASLVLNTGENVQLTASVLPANAANTAVSWKSSDAKVLTVYKGKITAKASGTAIVTVTTADGNYTAECAVTVR